MRNNHDGIAREALVFVCGGIVGAGVALVLAPQSGSETRRRVHDRIQEVQSDVRELVDEMVEECRTRGEQGLTLGKETAQKLREDVVQALDSGRTLVCKQIDRLEKAAKLG